MANLPEIPSGVTLAVDIETRDGGLEAGGAPGWVHRDGHIAGIAVAWENEAHYISLRHPDSENAPEELAFRWLEDALRRASTTIGHNISYDIGWLSAFGVSVPDTTDDTMAMAVMVDENRLGYNLDACCKWRGVRGKDETKLRAAAEARGFDAKSDMWRMPASEVEEYARQDARATLHLYQSLAVELDHQELWPAYTLERSLIPVTLAMRRRGIRIDEDRAATVRADLLSSRDAVVEDTRKRIGAATLAIQDFRSPVALARLFDAEGLEYPLTPKTRKGSFQSDFLKSHTHWLPQAVAKARELDALADKFIGTYILGATVNGRIHAEIHQLRNDDGGTRSFRLSYSNPPLQQIPARSKLAPLVRGIFLPDEGEVWASCDYCHDDQTEILTEEGWKLFKDLTRKERVAQWDNGVIELVYPSDYYVGECKNREMVYARGARKVDFCVTPEHKCMIDGVLIEARQLPAVIESEQITKHGILSGEVEIEKGWLQLVVALQADAADRKGTWRFYLSKQRKIERLVEILDSIRLPFRYKKHANGKKDAIIIDDHETIRRFLSYGKVFNLKELLTLSPDLRRVFVEETQYWDGGRAGFRGNGWGYGSTTLENVETVSVISTVSGLRTKTRAPHRWRADRKLFSYISVYPDDGVRKERVRPKRVEYFGRVYCVTVPSHRIVTRRNGRVMISGQSQQEPRIAVHLSTLAQVPGAAAAAAYYAEDPNADFHSIVAEITGIPRKRAKIINLGVMYGMGVPKLCDSLGVSLAEGKSIIAQYHAKMPFIRAISQLAKRMAEDRGYIKLLDGARCHFNNYGLSYGHTGEWFPPTTLEGAKLKAEGRRIERADTHKAFNRAVQGGAARQTKKAMLDCYRAGITPLIQMHDELAISTPDEAGALRLAEIMKDAIPLRVPMKVDIGWGRTWGEASDDDNPMTFAQIKRAGA